PAPMPAAQPPVANGLPPVDLNEIAADDLPLPTPQGRFLVAGTDDVEVFVILGRAGYGAIQSTLRRAGIDTRSLGRVLDFGCGVGRVLRYWKAAPAVEMHGTDLNPDAIAWCRENLAFAQFTTNRLEPHLDYPDNHFGLVYALSVFTHLPEEMQVPWLAELKRVVRPGGHVYFTTHGVSYRAALPPPMRAQFDADQLVGGGNDAGSNYYGTFHPTSYVRRAMLDPLRLTLIDFEPEGAKGNPTQDSWLVRKS
ncbi:class I SAM-dependent methyltransferase, partial [Acidisphaera rubrifaciens]|uniref:class I SAM-dependent methyltransferase n=1 Tax=Acidisphaera rubrifaciens TaxID=50715 RepID=UPI0011DE13FE